MGLQSWATFLGNILNQSSTCANPLLWATRHFCDFTWSYINSKTLLSAISMYTFPCLRWYLNTTSTNMCVLYANSNMSELGSYWVDFSRIVLWHEAVVNMRYQENFAQARETPPGESRFRCISALVFSKSLIFGIRQRWWSWCFKPRFKDSLDSCRNGPEWIRNKHFTISETCVLEL